MNEIMIIGSSQVLTASGADGTEKHLRFGAENDRVTLINRTWTDIHDMFNDAANLKKRYAIKHFIVAPYRPMSRRVMLTVALPAIAKEFKFDPLLCSVVEHEKDRADPEAFNIHWHVVTTHFNPDTKHVIDWWQDYMRQEKVGRILEYQLWLLDPDRDPAGPDFLIGRYHDAVIASLRDKTTPEYHPIAAALERAHPLGSVPDGTAPPSNVVRMHKRKGRNIVQLRKVCRDAWRKSTTDEEFRRLIEAEGLYVTLAEEPPPRWMITDGETVLGTLAGMAHAKRDDVLKRMGDPKYDDWYAGEGGRGRGGADAIDAGEGREAAEVVEIIVDRVPVMAVQPDGHRHGKTSSQLFIAALRRAEPSRLKTSLDRTTALAQSAFARAIAYLATAENGAREYLTRKAPDLPAPSDELSKLRVKRKLLEKKIADATAALKHQSGADRDYNLDVRGRARVDIEELNKLAAPLEASYTTEAEQYRTTRLERAARYLRIVPRIRALIDYAPQVLWAGVETIFARAMLEDKRATLGARFRTDPSSSPSAKDEDGYKPPGSTF